MEKFIHILRNGLWNSRHFCKLTDRRFLDLPYLTEIFKQLLPPILTYPRYLIQNGMYLIFAAELPVIFYRETVRFILQCRHHQHRFTALRELHFHIIIIQTSCSVVIIFYHTTHRNVKPQAIQYHQCNVYLSFTTVLFFKSLLFRNM